MKVFFSEKCRIEVCFEPRDLWVGCFWNRTGEGLKIYVCLMPCLPVIVTFRASTRDG